MFIFKVIYHLFSLSFENIFSLTFPIFSLYSIVTYVSVSLLPPRKVKLIFPNGFSAYWTILIYVSVFCDVGKPAVISFFFFFFFAWQEALTKSIKWTKTERRENKGETRKDKKWKNLGVGKCQKKSIDVDILTDIFNIKKRKKKSRTNEEKNAIKKVIEKNILESS